jgi:RNA polymerase-binding protein DksA
MATPPQQRTDIDVEIFKEMLLQERKRITILREQLHEDRQVEEQEITDSINDDSAESGDTAAAIYDHDVTEALDADERDILRQIDEALDRIANGTYGICVVTGEPIPVERLRALPWASMTVEAAERVGL